MQFTIQKEQLTKGLRAVSGVVERKHAQQNPILANVLLQAEGERLSVIASDQEVQLENVVHLDSIEQPGAITVPFKKLNDICRTLSDKQPIRVQLTEERFCLRVGRSRFVLSTLPAGDFPLIENKAEQKKICLHAKHFKQVIEKTAFAMAEQDVRYFLNGMLLELKNGKLQAIAADGHRLAINTIDLADNSLGAVRIIVPRKGITEILRLLDDSEQDIEVSFNRNYIRLQISNASLTSRLIEGKFPDYERVIPKQGDKVVIGPRVKLKEAFARASALFTDKFRGVKLNLSEEGLKILAQNSDQDEVEEDLEVQYQGQKLEIGFNVRYLLDFLNIVPAETVRLTFSDSNQSALLQGVDDDSGVYVIMPMRI